MGTDNAEQDISVLVDAVYDEAVSTTGRPPATGIFDKRVLLPLPLLPEAVAAETGEVLPTERLNTLVDVGWLPAMASPDTGEPAFALYAPSRVGLLLYLERAGYDSTELRRLAEYEEGFIDAILVNEETPYLEDDQDVLLLEWRTRLDWARRDVETADDKTDLLAQIEQLERSISFLETQELENMSAGLREKTGRMAYRVRFSHEWVRVTMLHHERAKMHAGYSPYLTFRTGYFGFDDARPPVEGAPNWDSALREPWAWEEDASIRLPGMRIVGEQISLSGPMRPSDYEQRWKQYDLDSYFRIRARVLGERQCPQCHADLPAGAHERRLLDRMQDERQDATLPRPAQASWAGARTRTA